MRQYPSRRVIIALATEAMFLPRRWTLIRLQPVMFLPSKMKTILFAGLMIVANAICLQAQTTEDSQKWNDLIKGNDLPEIAQAIEHPSTASWPKLISNASMSLKGNAYKPSNLGNALFEKIRVYEKSVSRQEGDSEKAAIIYGSLSRGLQNSGGYINLCLADTVNRLALARLSELLINDPSLAENVKGALANLPSVHFSTPQFVQMIHDEPTQKLKGGINLTPLEDKEAEKQVCAALGTNPGQIMVKFASNQAGTSTLLDDLQIGVLFERMAQTDTVARVDLAGLIEFLLRGGKYSDINLADIRPFQAIMSGSEAQFKSDLMRIHGVGADDLFYFIDQFKNNASNNLFVKIALQ